MKRVKYTESFVRNYHERVAYDPRLVEQYEKQLAVFKSNRLAPKLNDHYLSWEMQGLRAFSVTNDVRVVYEESDNFYEFKDIGTHEQVYKQG